MKRAENCVACKINHITFRNDSLVFEFAKSKGHQKGEKHVGPWHVYVNPFKPWIFPVLSMARYVFSFSDVLTGDMPLFEGNNQYARFMYCFEVALESLKAELTVLGYNKGDLGSHSCRKGVATWIAGGCTVSPPICALCIRTGWIMGGPKDKYIFRESAGDQYVGRCASGHIGMKYIIRSFTKTSKRQKQLAWKTMYNKMSVQNVFNNQRNKAYDCDDKYVSEN